MEGGLAESNTGYLATQQVLALQSYILWKTYKALKDLVPYCKAKLRDIGKRTLECISLLCQMHGLA